MKILWPSFNLFLPVTLAVAVACGCQTPAEKKSRKLLSTLRLHLEATRNSTKAYERVPVYRAKPVWVNVEKVPFLTEGHVTRAQVRDVVGGFALSVELDHRGAALLEEYTTANRDRRLVIFCQFGDQLKDFRWLAAPVVSRRITDGVLTFTPDATRDEAEEIARGLNNVAKRVQGKWIDQEWIDR